MDQALGGRMHVTWPARTVWVAAVLLCIASVVFSVIAWSEFATDDLVFNSLGIFSSLLYATIGLLITLRARNAIGWILMFAGLALAFVAFGTTYVAVGLLTSPGSLPAPREVAAVTQVLWVPTMVSLAAMVLLFPTGSLPSPRWRPVLWTAIAGAAVGFLLLVVNPGRLEPDKGITFQNPLGIQSLRGLISTTLVGVAWVTSLAVAGCIIGLVVRYRRGDAELRQQVKWLAFAAAGAGAGLLFTLGSLLACHCDNSVVANVGWLAFFLILIFGIPGAIAIAVLKYRLYDIDVIISKAVLYGVLAAILTGVYVAIVIGVGTAVGSRGNSFLTIVAAVVIALVFQPLRQVAGRFANRIVYGRRATPYEVLSHFSERMADTYAADDVLQRMTRILAEGTGASKAETWLRIGDELRPSAAWPQHDDADSPVPLEANGELPALNGATRVVPVRHHGELLGALSVVKPPNEPLSPTEDKLLNDLASQAGLVLRNVRLTAELESNLKELRASRQRLVRAQDEERHRLERNLHDGAQQQLVALSVKERLAEGLIERDPQKAKEMLAAIQADTVDAIETLRDFARGIYPPVLADKGLSAALDAQIRKTTLPVELRAGAVGRYAREVEAAVYFCCLEALQNVSKHAGARSIVVHVSSDDGRLVFSVADDGAGFEPKRSGMGSGLQGMKDRLAALGGDLEVSSEPGRGTTVSGWVPATPDRSP
ncbi:MAG: hypothetical protein E6G61_05400 [Actinobacteria bacterium]|nr:MAG: hypothetical protein E6G61_05400 [Actinomycetota bacterium]